MRQQFKDRIMQSKIFMQTCRDKESLPFPNHELGQQGGTSRELDAQCEFSQPFERHAQYLGY